MLTSCRAQRWAVPQCDAWYMGRVWRDCTGTLRSHGGRVVTALQDPLKMMWVVHMMLLIQKTCMTWATMWQQQKQLAKGCCVHSCGGCACVCATCSSPLCQRVMWSRAVSCTLVSDSASSPVVWVWKGRQDPRSTKHRSQTSVCSVLGRNTLSWACTAIV